MTYLSVTDQEGNEIKQVDVSGKSTLEIVQMQNSLEAENTNTQVDIVEVEEPTIQRDDLLILPVVAKSFRPLSDGSYNITYNTGELSELNIIQLHRTNRSSGILLFKLAENITDSELSLIDDFKTDDLAPNKSLSKRLQHALFRLYEQENPSNTVLSKEERQDAFRDFYKLRMERLINQVKDRLNP